MFYSSTNDIYLGFRVVDGSTSTRVRYMKFRDSNPPVLHWAKTSLNEGYVLALSFEESQNALLAGVFSKISGTDYRAILRFSTTDGSLMWGYR